MDNADTQERPASNPDVGLWEPKKTDRSPTLHKAHVHENHQSSTEQRIKGSYPSDLTATPRSKLDLILEEDNAPSQSNDKGITTAGVRPLSTFSSDSGFSQATTAVHHGTAAPKVLRFVSRKVAPTNRSPPIPLPPREDVRADIPRRSADSDVQAENGDSEGTSGESNEESSDEVDHPRISLRPRPVRTRYQNGPLKPSPDPCFPIVHESNRFDEGSRHQPYNQRTLGYEHCDYHPMHSGYPGSNVPFTPLPSMPHYGPDQYVNITPHPSESPYPQGPYTYAGTSAFPNPYQIYRPHFSQFSLPLPQPTAPPKLSSRPVKLPQSLPVSPEVEPSPISPQLPSATVAQETSDSLQDIDHIATVDAFVEKLKKKNEQRMIDAHRVLTYIDQRSSSIDPSPKVPDVFSFQSRDEDADIPDGHTESSVVLQAAMRSPSDPSFPEPSTPILSAVEETYESSVSEEAVSQRGLNGTFSASLSSDRSARRVVPPLAPINKIPEDIVRSPVVSYLADSLNEEIRIHSVVEDRAESTLLEELNTLRQDMVALKRQANTKNSSWLSSAILSTFTSCKKYFRRSPRLGTQRLEWTCECGEEMFADLPIANSVQYQQMLEFLTRPPPAPTPRVRLTSQNQSTPDQLERGASPLNYTSAQLSPSRFAGANPAASASGSSNTYVDSNSSQFFTSQPSSLYARTKYLELCVNIGKYETKLAEIQISSNQANSATICTDGHLFRKIHDHYFELRKQTWRRFFYRPAGIKFVHFGVEEGYRVNFFSKDPLPPEDALATKRYEYNLNPPVPPPIDSRTFLHYFYNHSAYSGSTSAKYVDRLPKKLGESLVRSLAVDELREGWGIHIIEGPNKVAICWVLMVVLIVSFGVSVGYDLIQEAEDSGFAIGQWMVAVVTVALSTLYFSLEDEVISNVD